MAGMHYNMLLARINQHICLKRLEIPVQFKLQTFIITGGASGENFNKNGGLNRIKSVRAKNRINANYQNIRVGVKRMARYLHFEIAAELFALSALKMCM